MCSEIKKYILKVNENSEVSKCRGIIYGRALKNF